MDLKDSIGEYMVVKLEFRYDEEHLGAYINYFANKGWEFVCFGNYYFCRSGENANIYPHQILFRRKHPWMARLFFRRPKQK